MPEQAKTPRQPQTKRTPAALQAPTRRLYTHRNRTVAVPEGYLAVGLILGVHGLRGELKVELYTDFPERFTVGADLFIGEDLAKVEIIGARMHQQHLLLQLAGVESREQADKLRNLWLFVDEEDAAELADGVYWVHDIIGLTVQTENGEALGVIRDVLFTGANDVYVVETPPTVNSGRDLLLPAIAEVVRNVDLADQRMTVHLLPGLLE
jgi:16S rRNA processing protein RimM